MKDIYDGILYKEHSASGKVLSFWNNLSLMWNVDGVPIFKSSKFSISPLYLVINELPYHLRMLKENTLFDDSYLATTGIHICSPLYQNPFDYAVILLASTCDLPAKCLVLNTIQFNGKNGCSKCLQPGVSCTTSRHGHTHVYIPLWLRKSYWA